MAPELSTLLLGTLFFIGRAHPLEGLRACSLILFFYFFFQFQVVPEPHCCGPGIPGYSFKH